MSLQRLLLLQPVDCTLEVGHGLGQLLVCGMERDDIGCHVRGLRNLLGGKTTPGWSRSLNFTQFGKGSLLNSGFRDHGCRGMVSHNRVTCRSQASRGLVTR